MLKKNKNKLDKLWAERVKTEAGWRCERCGKTNTQIQLHPHHIIGRRHFSLRWVLENGIALCASHHTLGLDSAHCDPVGFVDWLKAQRGDKRLKEINLLKGKINKFSYEDNLAMMDMSLGEIIKKYGNQ